MSRERPLPVLQAWDCGNGHSWACAEQMVCPVCGSSSRHREFGATALPTWESLRPEVRTAEQVAAALWELVKDDAQVVVERIDVGTTTTVERAVPRGRAPFPTEVLDLVSSRVHFVVEASLYHDKPRDARHVSGTGLTFDAATSAMLRVVERLLVEWRAMREGAK